MDDQTTQTNSPAHPIVDVMPTSAPTPITQISYQKKRKTGWIILLIILIVLIAVAVWFFYFHDKKTTKPFNQAATLQTLESTSAPVTATVEERAATATALSKQSLPVTPNKQNQLC
jgi:flagellar basal body-associated protein FliL